MRRHRYLLLLVSILAAVVASRGLLLVAMPGELQKRYRVSGTDYKNHYLPVAESVVAGKGFTHPTTQRLDTRYPPGYPAYLAGGLLLSQALGLDFTAVRMALDNLIVVPLTIFGVVLLWQMLGLRFIWAVLAGLAFAVYPAYVWGTVVPATIPLFTLLLVWTCVAWAKMMYHPDSLKWYCAFGAGLGLSMLVRPTPLLIPFLAIPVLLLRQRPWTHILYMAACVLIVVGPWILAASAAERHFLPLSTGGLASVHDGISRFPQNPVAQAFLGRMKIRSDLPSLFPLVVTQFMEHPFASIELWGQKLARVWYGTDTGGHIEWVLAAMNAPIVALGAIGRIRICRNGTVSHTEKLLHKDGIGLLIYFWLTTALVLSIVRYMVPVMWIPIGYGLVCVKSGWHSSPPSCH